jgi:hypothetical protein
MIVQDFRFRYLYIPMNQLHRGDKTTYTEEYLTTKICNNIFFVWNSDYTITADIDNSLRNSIYTSTRLTKAKILDNHRSVFCSLGISTKDKERVSIRSKRFIGILLYTLSYLLCAIDSLVYIGTSSAYIVLPPLCNWSTDIYIGTSSVCTLSPPLCNWLIGTYRYLFCIHYLTYSV